MPTDPFVPSQLKEQPRHDQNLRPGVALPPARPWRVGRPGDLPAGWPEGTLLGSPGPNVGYAMGLVHRVQEQMQLGEHEDLDDAVAVTAELAMRRAARFGRAPVPADVAVARALLGYDGNADEEFSSWRAHVIAGAAHDYPIRREVVDGVPEAVLRAEPTEAAARAAEARDALRAVLA